MLSPDSFVGTQKEALVECRRLHGNDHPKVAELLSVLGLFYHHVVHDFESALVHHEEALVVLRSQPGDSHKVEVAVTLTDIGNVYRSMGDHPRALSSYEEAIAAFTATSTNENHPSLQAANRGISMLTRKLG
uniref:Kinesin light chain n=1 Tax=Trieres chinensis TaxID=1514140 RepID=A0A7S1Z6L2_TRICV|mmetsp:Transcript_18640/g.37770  ORF Transcript_18640/g.37770 Transcript_18640/m.37770 type:complete len:132 (+) Transcript_18640:151-546(+)